MHQGNISKANQAKILCFITRYTFKIAQYFRKSRNSSTKFVKTVFRLLKVGLSIFVEALFDEYFPKCFLQIDFLYSFQLPSFT